MKKSFLLFVIGFIVTKSVTAQIDAGLFRYPDVSKTQIVFTYANDIWVIPKEGGTAIKLSSPAGVEVYPKFSPDGKSIAYSGNYDGNYDAYVIPVNGGVPVRLTGHGYPDRVVDWTADGKKVLFASRRESGKERFNQFYTIPATGGAAEKLPLAYAEYGSYSPDGKQMAVVFRTQVGRNWKRYRGGWKADIQIFNFATKESTPIGSEQDAGNEFPMWNGNAIYFLSDRGAELKMNLWKYDLGNKSYTQLTHFKDYDLQYPSMGPDDIVFQAGGKMYLYNLASGKQNTVNINVITDRTMLKPKIETVDKLVQDISISPDGNRVLVQARGDIFSVPAENGYVKDLTRTSGVAERYPAWSPDGKYIAYWSDQSGEYELWVTEPDKENSAKKLTSYGPGFRYTPYWSPDSKKIAFIDKAMQIKIFDLTNNKTTDVDRALRYTHGNLQGFSVSWSPDSRWMAYSRDAENSHSVVYIYDYQNKKNNQVTSGFYSCDFPVFDTEGKYLYLLTNQSFSPSYSDIDNTFIYANSTQLAAISLSKETQSILTPKNDTVALKTEEEKDEKGKNGADDKKADSKSVAIDFDGMEQRIELLPPSPGNYGFLGAAKGKIVYIKSPNTGEAQGKRSLKFFDLNKKEEKTIIDNVGNVMMSADHQKILVSQAGKWAVISPGENQKIDKPLALGDMQMMIDPVKEWKQLFTDAWRLERDYFYDSKMHGVDWNEVKARYSKMLEGAMTREEVDFVIGEMIGELNASHTYHGGGDVENTENKSVGYLGVNWKADGKYYKIDEIIRGASWDAEARSSLDAPGVNIKEGDYILAVNGIPLTTEQEPFIAFTGLADKTVEITYNSKPGFDGAKTAIVKTMADESRLRNLAWIENMRKQVDKETNGEVGYIFVPSTGVDGQNELIRQFNAQWNKKALVIDERFNNGGQIPDRFIEMLNRDPLAFWAIRDGEDWPWPPFAHFGPKVMLINGWSGSGGDAFPDYFRRKKLGPLIGARTWGGLIGISGVPGLVDGGGITAPTFRMYNPDGTWFKEGHGVEPDIAVPEDLGMMAKGIDPQLQKAIAEIKQLLKTKEYKKPPRPSQEKRGF
ncbi:MAG TPA: PDZ domain-containing protein [Chitinophagaceae bacterium]|nr:PDZ domain-containing protein [Chitinophagaceae bacterium]